MNMLNIQIDPDPHLIENIASCAPENPFYTAQYARSQQMLGYQPAAIRYQDDAGQSMAFPGFLKRGRLNAILDIPSIPDLQADHPVWSHIGNFCRKKRVTKVTVNSYASPAANIPDSPYLQERWQRTEYILQLHGSDPRPGFSGNHKRNIKKAAGKNYHFTSSVDDGFCDDHVALMGQSMHRRSARGEEVSTQISVEHFRPLLQARAGRLFQLRKGDEIVSSMLVLMAKGGAYYHSGGTGTEGMKNGAAYFLFDQIIRYFQNEGIRLLNFGGAEDENPGLQRFKEGFGCQRIDLEAASMFYTGAFGRFIYKLSNNLR